MIREFGPESLNPRERRAYAHAMIEAHRRREIPRQVAEHAIAAAGDSSKSQASGFDQALDRASSYEAVAGAGNAYHYPTWPYPPSGSPKFHLVFDRLDRNNDARTPVRYGTEAWPVLRDELVARGYGMHDAGYGIEVAVVLDRDLECPDQVELWEQYGWIGHTDHRHLTSFV